MAATAPTYTLRQATSGDFAFMRETKLDGMRPYVEAIWGWNRQQQEQLFAERFAADQSQIIIVGGIAAGFIVLDEEPDALFLAGIYLVAAMRRRGLGAAILRNLMSRALRRGKPLTLRVLKVNPARRLYERLGWQINGETDAHYLMRWPAAAGSEEG
jgi:GNAT superfamily N-acetyltransferase